MDALFRLERDCGFVFSTTQRTIFEAKSGTIPVIFMQIRYQEKETTNDDRAMENKVMDAENETREGCSRETNRRVRAIGSGSVFAPLHDRAGDTATFTVASIEEETVSFAE